MGRKDSKLILWKQNFLQNLYLYQSNSLRNLMRCKTFYSKSDTFWNFRVQFYRILKKWLWVWRVWNSWFKTRRVVQKMIQKLNIFKNFDPNFFIENNSFRNKFFKNAQKSQLWRFYGVNWLAKWFFESEYSISFCLSKNSFFIDVWCAVETLIQVPTLCRSSIQMTTNCI